MSVIWKGLKIGFLMLLTLGLVFTSGLFSLLLYGKLTGKQWAQPGRNISEAVVYAEPDDKSAAEANGDQGKMAEEPPAAKKPSARLSAPAIHQFPELPSGCEVTSLTMLLQYYGIDKSKTELAEEMPKDPTPIRLNKDGSVAYWGNPNTGFVGEVTGKAKGFGIYHAGLLPLLKKYVPTAFDLTGRPFEEIERQISEGIPVVVWTTINFVIPQKWVVWDTPLGPIRTTFSEHAVLMVGYDEQYVYVNDPWTGKADVRVDKERFIKTWELMGKQAISYRK